MTHAKQELTIAVAATFTAEPLEESLVYWARELGLSARIRFAPYGQVFQPLLDASGLFLTNQHGLNVLLVKPDDWEIPGCGNGDSHGAASEVEAKGRDLAAAIGSAAGRAVVPCLVIFCPPSPATAANTELTWTSHRLEWTVLTDLRQVNGVYCVGSSELLGTYPVASCFHGLLDREAHVPFTPAFYVALATMITRRLFVLTHRPYKAIVLDCDRTLWNGVCGEDAIEDIPVDGPYRSLQEFTLAQRDAGMVLCICSRNNEADVLRVFDHHPHMVLRREHIASWRLNWARKSENLKSIADELDIATDSLVFVDDDPVECAEIRTELPEILTVQLPVRAEDIPRFLRHIWAFDHLTATQEDRARAASYTQNAARARLRKKALTFGEFLAGLDLEVRTGPMAPANLARVAQLTTRTNQFNCTAIRRCESEIQRILSSGELECLVVHVKDRFGDYGLVGTVMFAATAESITVETFLLSCRVLGRGVEHRVLRELGRMAKNRGIEYIDIRFSPTGRNQPALDFLNGLKIGIRQPDGHYLVFRLPAHAAAGAAFDPDCAGTQPHGPSHSAPQAETNAMLVEGESELLCRVATESADVRQVLKNMELKGRGLRPAATRADYVPPRTHTEKALCEIWSGLLGMDPVSTHHNFFDIGGHSLLATQVLSRIYDRFDVELSIQAVFDAPTVTELAATVEIRQIEAAEPQEVLAMMHEFDNLTDEQVETLLSREG
jgi:FkbH-like protein